MKNALEKRETLKQFDKDQKKHLHALSDEWGCHDEGMWDFMYRDEDEQDIYEDLAEMEEDIEAQQTAAALKNKKGRSQKVESEITATFSNYFGGGDPGRPSQSSLKARGLAMEWLMCLLGRLVAFILFLWLFACPDCAFCCD